MSLTKRASIIGSAVLALALPQLAPAATIGFEDPPYTAGTSLYGQNGWVLNAYMFGLGGNNGSLDVSTTAPLAGNQSALYTQIGAGFGADASKPEIISVARDGTTANDLTGSVLLQADAAVINDGSRKTGQLGLFLSHDATNGLSPVGVLLEGADSSTGAGNLLVLDGSHTSPYRLVGSYVPNNVYEFAIGVDFDNANYDVSYRNLTAGETAFTPLTGGGTGGRFDFFGTFAEEGGTGNYVVDAGLTLRSGTGRIDNITLAAAAIPEPGTAGLALLAMSGLAARRRRRSRESR